MSVERPTRRRAIAIFAAAACAPLAGMRTARADQLHQWRGIAMGAEAGITFSGVDIALARSIAQAVTAEIERLEGALSLFREQSEISRLNRYGSLLHPSADLRAALQLSQAIAAATGGLFDPTVQSLWEAHADWFAGEKRATLPPDALILAARRNVGWHGISVASDIVRMRPGQRITLNGLGQGYVTDRVAGLLHARGFSHVLVDLGEQLALGARADGLPWMVARASGEPIALRDGGLATSEASGCVFGADGAAHHLFDPRSGRSAAQWRRIIVHHRSAAVADALSTALYAATPREAVRIVARFPGIMVWATTSDGRNVIWSTPPVLGVDLARPARG
jgi:thiamine biosynthesis lipoprotein